MYGFFGMNEATESGGRHAAHVREVRNVYTDSVEKPEGKKPLEYTGVEWIILKGS
jgi:hypothetical protein